MRYKMELEKRKRAGLWSDGLSQMLAETIWTRAQPGLGQQTLGFAFTWTGVSKSARHSPTTVNSSSTWAAS